MTPETLYRLAYVILIAGIISELFLFILYTIDFLFFMYKPEEIAEARKNLFAAAISLIILSILYSSPKIIDWLLGLA